MTHGLSRCASSARSCDIAFPDEGANAVIVQPGGVEYTVWLRPDKDPGFRPQHDHGRPPPDGHDQYWEQISGDKIGGTPAFFQGDDWPGGGPWKLALQLNSNFQPFHLNLGAAPTAFVSPDAKQGRLLVQDT
ncbi:hypothetical protein ACWDBW_31745 [Streptomyces sp. NPDC001107]